MIFKYTGNISEEGTTFYTGVLEVKSGCSQKENSKIKEERKLEGSFKGGNLHGKGKYTY